MKGGYIVEVANVYMHKEGRLMAYIKEGDKHQVVSYPRVIMENYLGRKLLPTEEVHHKDENPLNNEIDNLEVLTKEEHLRLHVEENRKYFDKIMTCPICGNTFLWTAEQQMRFHSNVNRKERKGKTNAYPFCSKSCAGKYSKNIQLSNYKNSMNINTDFKLNSISRKLANEQVKYIRNNYKPRDKKFSSRALSRKFNVNHKVIYDIIHNITYTNVV